MIPATSPYREPLPRPPPPRPVLTVAIGVALLCAGLAAFTSHKLFVMAQLRGDIEGIPPIELTMGGQKRKLPSGAGVHALVDPARSGAPPRQIQLTEAQFFQHRPGSRVTVRCEDDGNCYIPGAIYIDDGNRSFDIALLVIELLGLVACLVSIGRRTLAYRALVRANAFRPGR